MAKAQHKGRAGGGPRRLKNQRRKGWRKPEGAVYVGRPTKWGNPFKIGPDGDRAECMRRYRDWALDPAQADLRAAARAELNGKDLLCWCDLDVECHADTLLEIANGRLGG